MYEPVFNSVVVQIDDKDAEWGSGNDESMLGKSFRLGTVILAADAVSTAAYPEPPTMADIAKFKGRKIIWNEGTEAGTVFEFDGKQFGMIYWWDIRGVLVEAPKKAASKQEKADTL